MKFWLISVGFKVLSAFLLLISFPTIGLFGQTPVKKEIVLKQLTIGQPAPPLTVHSWLKGDGITTFEKGMTYVVDFNSTYCAPCVNTIPQLHKIANKFKGKVKVISIYNHEYLRPFEDHYNNVKKRVEMFGDDLNFSVGIDVPGRTTEADWNGKRTTYAIVDLNGKIAFTGSSYTGQWIDDALTALLKGESLNPVMAASKSIAYSKTEKDFKLHRINPKVAREFRFQIKKDGALGKYEKDIDSIMQASIYGEFTLPLDIFIFLKNKKDATAINAYLKMLPAVADKLDYWYWHFLISYLGGFGNSAPHLHQQLDWNLVAAICDRALNDVHLVVFRQDYVATKLYSLLFAGRYDEAMAMLENSKGSTKAEQYAAGLKNREYHQLIAKYLMLGNQSGKTEADKWFSAAITEQKINVVALTNLVAQHLGKSTAALQIYDALHVNKKIN